MAMVGNSVQLIDGDGKFNAIELDYFLKKVNLAKYGVSYGVVAIIGPQSSGKSTLLNKLFGTSFEEMKAKVGRSQTTRGIWLAPYSGMQPFTIVMDIEGADGSERGEDDTKFEKQSALFALAVADIVLVNIWYNDIGREQAAGKPLLRIVFEAIQKLSSRKKTLMFVVRDTYETPVETLEKQLKDDAEKIWDSIRKTETHRNTRISDLFNVEVACLSHYKLQKDVFNEEILELRKRLYDPNAPDGLAGNRCAVVPGSDFAQNVQKIWEQIKKNKDIDIPKQKVMLANMRCGEISNAIFASFEANETWLQLKENVQSQTVTTFGETVETLIKDRLREYNEQTEYYDGDVRSNKRGNLKNELLKLVEKPYLSLLEQIRKDMLRNFKAEFDSALKERKGFAKEARVCTKRFMEQFDKASADANKDNWDTSSKRNQLENEINEHVSSLRDSKLSELLNGYERKLNETLSKPVKKRLQEANATTWDSIRSLLEGECGKVVSFFCHSLLLYEIDEPTRDAMVEGLEKYAREIVKKNAKEVVDNALEPLMIRFYNTFKSDNTAQTVEAMTKPSYDACLEVLSILAVVRLDEKDYSWIEEKLSRGLLGPTVDECIDILSSTTWDEVESENTLLTRVTPIQCRSVWRQLKAEMVQKETSIGDIIIANAKAKNADDDKALLSREILRQVSTLLMIIIARRL